MTMTSANVNSKAARVLYLSTMLFTLAGSISNLALARLVLDISDSVLLSAIALFGSSIAGLIGASTLMSIADTVPPRRILAWCTWLATGVIVFQAFGDPPVFARLAVEAAAGFCFSILGAARWGLLSDLVGTEEFGRMRAKYSVGFGIFQLIGFGIGAILLTWFTPVTALLVSLGICSVSALMTSLLLPSTPARRQRHAKSTVGETWAVNLKLLGNRRTLRALLLLWLPLGVVGGCEGLFIAIEDVGQWLFVSYTAGLVFGNYLLTRNETIHKARRIIFLLCLVCGVPYLLTGLIGIPALFVVGVALAGALSCVTVMLQQQVVEQTDSSVHGQALGLSGTGLAISQAIAAVGFSALAEFIPAFKVSSIIGLVAIISCLLIYVILREERSVNSVS